MALITATIAIDPTWEPEDVLLLLVGSENAATLAASTPPGGRVVSRVPVAEFAGTEGDLTLGAEIAVTDKAAMLPIGVAVEDAIGNRSLALESFEQVADAPRGARDHTITPTANPGEALLSFVGSADVL